MSNFKRLAAGLLLTLLGAAGAQSAHSVYFVFKLATTLPVILEAAPECVAEREARLTDTLSLESTHLLETYSFVSLLDAATLRREIGAFAEEHGFDVAGDLAAQNLAQGSATADGWMADGEAAGRDFSDISVPGARYAVRLYDRPQGGGVASVLCVTVLAPPVPDEPTPSDE